ncbi:aminomethyltransferase [Coleophoma crateriformis]|uniref:Aminomethyltransferase n=1 Tax=Coleophoma crateriformis TaxID=565419 RepID=A0A3D8Q9B8_9HELO|nr:aminomethyltransferase [Coleophoma crateriformis]
MSMNVAKAERLAIGLYRGVPNTITRTSQLTRRMEIRSLCISQKPRGSVNQQSNHVTGSSRPVLMHLPRGIIAPKETRRNISVAPTSSLKKTALYDLHLSSGAKMVPFAGYWMPVQYSDLAVGESHRWTREKASLFDVGHMVQHRLTGPGAAGLLKRLTPASIDTLPLHRSTLSAFLHPVTGGIVDDTIISRLGPEDFYIVTNAACRDKDISYLTTHLAAYRAEFPAEPLTWEILEDWGLIALQGPRSASILSDTLANPQTVNLNQLYFGQSKFLSITLADGSTSPPLLVSRAGYTGEDGFEISIPQAFTTSVAGALLKAGGAENLRWAGLGARDSLRLEAGMCLYGHDLDDSTTPVEAALGWIVGQDRRAEGGFFGDEIILGQLKPKKNGGLGLKRRRVGLVVEGAPAREGADIVDDAGSVIGKVTSGCPSPTLGTNVAMGYIKEGFHKSKTEVAVLIRGKKRKAVVTKMPFVASKYWKEGS